MNDSAINERRRFHRVLHDAPVTIQTDQGPQFETTLLDISLKGALAVAPKDWQPQAGEAVTLIIHLNEQESVITMRALCAHNENEKIGFLCDEIDMDSITLLRRLVELNIGDESVLQRDLAALG